LIFQREKNKGRDENLVITLRQHLIANKQRKNIVAPAFLLKILSSQ